MLKTEELAEPIRNLADYIPDIELNEAFHESYELDHFPVDLRHLATNNEAPMMSIASVLLVVTPNSMRVECTTTSRQYVDMSSITVNDRLAIAFKSTGVANWDLQRTVVKFLTEKNTEGDSP